MDRQALARYFVWYNFVKLHKAHKLTPAMAAEKPGKRGPYKKRVAA
jgi:hypothetical protein